VVVVAVVVEEDVVEEVVATKGSIVVVGTQVRCVCVCEPLFGFSIFIVAPQRCLNINATK